MQLEASTASASLYIQGCLQPPCNLTLMAVAGLLITMAVAVLRCVPIENEISCGRWSRPIFLIDSNDKHVY